MRLHVAVALAALVATCGAPAPVCAAPPCPALDLRAPVPWAGTPWSADAALLCDLYAARDALGAIRAQQARARRAGPCTRAVKLRGGDIAPCDVEGLPAPTLDALLAQQDLARKRAVWLDEMEAKALNAAKACAADAAAATRGAKAKLAAADAHVAALEERLREVVKPATERWTFWRAVGVVAAAVAAVAAGVPCARGEAGWCAVSGSGAGVAAALIAF